MINAIKNKFVAILDDMDEQRAAADLSFRHEIKLHTREIYNVWLRQIRRVERKHGVNLGLTDAAVKKALRPCINKVFKRTNIHQILRRQVAYGLDKPGDAGYLTIHASGDPLTIVLVSGNLDYFVRYGLALINSFVKNGGNTCLVINCVDFTISQARKITDKYFDSIGGENIIFTKN